MPWTKLIGYDGLWPKVGDEDLMPYFIRSDVEVLSTLAQKAVATLAAAAAAFHQSCPTVCDPTDGSPLRDKELKVLSDNKELKTLVNKHV